MSRLFGTDGIRGHAGRPPLDVETVTRVGSALVRVLPASASPVRVLIGGDTRESFEWIARALASGLRAAGATVVNAGVLPTPGVAFLTTAGRFAAGIVISASHNPYQDNGIKMFSTAGSKLDEASEKRIEALVADSSWTPEQAADDESRQTEAPADLRQQYRDHLRRLLTRTDWLAESQVVIDCANGATVTMAPELFQSLGLAVTVIGDQPDGRNINLACGSTHLATLQERVLDSGARLGVAFDGDGDRALFVDHTGAIVDGDAVLYIAALDLQRRGMLTGNAVVATVMSNIGLELALQKHGIALLRAPVGDKYVMEQMQQHGLVLGGEQSGHIIFAEHLFTGDGLATALQMLRVMERSGQELRTLTSGLRIFPQVLVNVRVRERSDFLQVPAIAEALQRVEARVQGNGRVLVRYSGTEPLLRIMIEGQDDGEIRTWANEIADSVRKHLG